MFPKSQSQPRGRIWKYCLFISLWLLRLTLLAGLPLLASAQDQQKPEPPPAAGGPQNETGPYAIPKKAEEPPPPPPEAPPPPLEVATRLGSGIPGLDPLLGQGFLRRSVTLVSGSPGVGKTVFGLQYLLEGAARREPGLYVTLEEGPAQLLATAEAMGLPLQAALDAGLIQILYLARENIRAGQFLTIVADRLTALKAARVVLDACVAKAAEMGVPQCVVIVDNGGHLLAFARMDGAKVLSTFTATQKAQTAASSRAATGAAPQDFGVNLGLASGGRVTNLKGGLPILVKGKVVGAIGIGSGAPDQDVAVAEAGIEALHKSLG